MWHPDMIFIIVVWTIIWQDATTYMRKGEKSQKFTKSSDEEVFNINIHEFWLWFSSLVISWIHLHTHMNTSAYFRFHLQTLTLVEQATLFCSYFHTFKHKHKHTLTHLHTHTNTFCINKIVIMVMEISVVGIHTEQWTYDENDLFTLAVFFHNALPLV